jgi:adenosylcobinamide-phosphate synthase
VNGAIAVVAAFGLDAAFGEPPNALHPVAWMGTAIARGRAWALKGGRAAQLTRGALVAVIVPSASAAIAFAITRAVAPVPLAAIVVTALALKPMFAVRALRDAAFRVRDALDASDLVAARRALGSLCSRDAAELDERALVAATIESIAENTSDSVVAPLFFFALFGLPGAAFYRAANTIDAMMGYHGELEWAGKVGARLDDVLNLVPARVTALLLVIAGALVGEDARRGVAIWRRDAARTESPNAGRPMAAMAGLLGVRLEKHGCYALGDDARPLEARDIARAWRVAWLASIGATALAACAIALSFSLSFLRGSHAR